MVVKSVSHHMQLRRRIVDAADSRCKGIMQGVTQDYTYLTLGEVAVTGSPNMQVAMHRQHKTGMDAVQGVISSMEETGVRTIRLGATQRWKEAPAAADESVPGGTTRLAMVDADPAVEIGAPILDVVLSMHSTHTSDCLSFGIIDAHATISSICTMHHAASSWNSMQRVQSAPS